MPERDLGLAGLPAEVDDLPFALGREVDEAELHVLQLRPAALDLVHDAVELLDEQARGGTATDEVLGGERRRLDARSRAASARISSCSRSAPRWSRSTSSWRRGTAAFASSRRKSFSSRTRGHASGFTCDCRGRVGRGSALCVPETPALQSRRPPRVAPIVSPRPKRDGRRAQHGRRRSHAGAVRRGAGGRAALLRLRRRHQRRRRPGGAAHPAAAGRRHLPVGDRPAAHLAGCVVEAGRGRASQAIACSP